MKPELILALDVDNFKKAKSFIDRLYPQIRVFKVGPVLLLACGDKVIRYIKKKSAKVFLDLKFFDIPHTIAGACRQVVRLGVDMFSIHLQAGLEVLRSAVEAVRQGEERFSLKKPLVLGVTTLTSQKKAFSIKQNSDLVKRVGLDGIICSAKEAGLFRRYLGRDFLIVSPGIRPQGFSKGDQQRIATPSEAVLAGVDYLVVGRPILEAEDPLKITKIILKEIDESRRGN
ncbi:MAG: orotidine-5'-phosphate decarboxylase [Candidatus Omnitrophica bacterium]|nr:orotidine-5'-phosphate decarboxylase [Candidatus Omnitrophota bacterium]